jgi:hypothetical protein
MTASALEDASVKHTKLMSLLFTILFCDLVLIAFSIHLLGFANIGMLLFMIYECWIILIETLQTILKYKMFLVEYYNHKTWEGREEIGYLLDFALEISRLASAIVHNFHIWMVDGYSLSIIDLALFMLINQSFKELRKHVNRFMQFLSVTSVIIHSYQYATAEELKDNETCIICHDTMSPTNAKRLECSHIFHVACIKKWMQKSFTCPICRKPLANVKFEPSPVVHSDHQHTSNENRVVFQPSWMRYLPFSVEVEQVPSSPEDESAVRFRQQARQTTVNE